MNKKITSDVMIQEQQKDRGWSAKLPYCPKDTAQIPDCVFGKSYSPKACIKKMKKKERTVKRKTSCNLMANNTISKTGKLLG